jgi:hypothetical protein
MSRKTTAAKMMIATELCAMTEKLNPTGIDTRDLVLVLTKVLIDAVTVLSPTKKMANENLERIANKFDDAARDPFISGTATGAVLGALAKCLIETEPSG